MSYHGQKLINSIKDNVSAINLELICKEFQYIEDSQKIESSDDIICSLISIVGNYLVSAENRKIPEEFAIFDTFCCLDFMSEFLKLSSYDLYKIDLQLIKMLSFLLINIKNKPWLYYLCSNNLLNKIISKDYSKYDDEFLSYYVNFLKSLSLLLDETSIQLFYIEKKNSFPLIENILKFYDHKDSMIRNVVRNTVMNIFRLKNAKIEEYFSKLPSVLYFVKIVNQIKNICFEMKDQINNQNNKKMSYLFDDLYDEIIYIDDLLNLNLERINYILINCFFHFFILPILCGSICNENKKLSKEMSLFIITFFFVNMKNEIFKNCLYTILFLDEVNKDIENFLILDKDINDFFMNNININNEANLNNSKSDISFAQFFSEHYSYYFLLTLIENNNIIYTKYGKIYPQLSEIIENGKELSNELIYGYENNKEYTYDEKVKKIHEIIDKFLDKEDLINMQKYHEYLSKATGLLIGTLNKENLNNKEKENLISKNCFLFQIKSIFNILAKKDENNLIKNKIKQNLFDLLNIKNEEILLLFNILIFVVQNKDTNISKILLKLTNLENVFENNQINTQNLKNIDINNPLNEINNIDSKISFNRDIFTFNNYYFSILDINLSEKKIDNKFPEELSIMLIKEIYFLPISFQIFYQNIINCSVNQNYTPIIDISDKLRKNIESKYKSNLFCTYSLFNNEPKNRENSYDVLYDQWRFYKDMNNKNLFQTIKKNILSKLDILTLRKNIDNNFEYDEGFEIINLNNLNFNKNNPGSDLLSSSKKENICFETNILIFMLIYDLKTIFKDRKPNGAINNFDIKNKLMKNKFPLDFSSYDFQIWEKYNINNFNKPEIYKQEIYFKIIGPEKDEEKDFIKCYIFFYRGFLYFGLRNQEDMDNILIFRKIDIKNIEQSKDYNQQGIENCLQIKLDDGKDEIILIKFDNKNIRKDFKDLINKKIMTSSNDERMQFSQFFEELIRKYRNNENNAEQEEF